MVNSGGIELDGEVPGLGRKVIVVDDDYGQRLLLKEWLEEAGFAVVLTTGPAEALRLIAEAPPDAIVSDILMDELDGFSFCRLLRADPALSCVPIVLMSAYFDEKADTALAREVGANALVVRSPAFEECIEVLVKSLAEQKPVGTPARAPSELYVHRVAHQLVRLRQGTARAEGHYQTLFEHASDAVSVLTREGRIVDANRRWEVIMQCPRAEIIGRNISEFCPSGHEPPCQIGVGNGIGRAGPVPIVRPDGTTVLMDFTMATFPMDGTENILAIGRDVTDVVEAQRKLEASERKYRSLIENIPAVVWSTTADGRLTFISPNVCTVCGFSPEEMLEGGIGASCSRVHPLDLPDVRASMTEALARRAPLEVECRWQHKDGRWIWLHFRGVAAINADGVECIDGVCSDVTARKQLEEQLYQSQKVETIGQLTAGIAHDFNNILAVIIANSEFLARELRGKENQEIASELSAAAQRGVDLTRGLLGFARRGSIESRPLDLNMVVDDIARMLVCTVGRKVALSMEPCKELGLVRADARQLQQVLMNLAVNARDAMPTGGTLTIKTANVDVAPECAEREGQPPAGRYVSLRVRDNGTGMSPETRARIFEPFFTTKGERGTGLGLSTCYGIARRYGGHLTVESALGAGTTFTMYLPRVDSDAPSQSLCA